jgi:KDO2-lipid IV(A) lauroyltransferase
MNPLRERCEYLLLCGLLRLLRPLPRTAIEGFFRGLGALFFLLSARRRRMTLANLAIAFPKKPLSERRRIAWRSFLNMAEFACDSFLMMANKLDPAEIPAMIDGSQLEKYKALRTPGTGALHLTGHLGNWELMARYGALQGLGSHLIARQGSNRLIDQKLIVPMRTAGGNKVFYKNNAMLHAMKALRRGETVSFLIDQKIGRKEGVPVRFFGQEILAVASCAALQLRLSPLVVAIFLVKTGPRRYRLLVSDPVEWSDTGARQEEQIRQLTQRHQTLIEEAIRAYPDQWFWMHNRFKLPDARTARREKRRARRQAATTH